MRKIAGCNQQLDGSSFSGDMNATWDTELGCPTFKYEGDIIPSYSWWYAVRTMAQQCIWMNARSSKYIGNFIAPVNEIEISGTNEIGQYVVRKGENVDIQITLPSDLKVGGKYNDKNINSLEVSIDEFTALPEGLTFADNRITGKLDNVCNKAIHVLVSMNLEGDTSATVVGKSFELIALANSPEVKVKTKKKGCFGDMAAISSVLATLMAAGASILLLKKKKED